VLVLTKPLGVGAVATARKRGARDDALLARAVEVMVELNAEAAAAARAAGARAVTDVTGYGLLAHLHGMATASGVAAEVEAARSRPSTASRRSWPTTAPSPAAAAATPPTRTASRRSATAWPPGTGGC
jgi:selenophosphate synthase